MLHLPEWIQMPLCWNATSMPVLFDTIITNWGICFYMGLGFRIWLWETYFMSSENGWECIEFHPSQQKFLTAAVSKEGKINSTVATNVTMVESITTEATCEQSCNSTLDAIMTLPTHHLVSCPKQCAPLRTSSISSSHEKYQLLVIIILILFISWQVFSRFSTHCWALLTVHFVLFLPLLQELPIQLCPQHWVLIMSCGRVFTCMQCYPICC